MLFNVTMILVSSSWQTVLIFYPIEKNRPCRDPQKTLRSSSGTLMQQIKDLLLQALGFFFWAMQLSVLGHLCVGKIMGKWLNDRIMIGIIWILEFTQRHKPKKQITRFEKGSYKSSRNGRCMAPSNLGSVVNLFVWGQTLQRVCILRGWD